MNAPPARVWLGALFGRGEGWVDVRWRRGESMSREWYRIGDYGLDRAADDILRLGRIADVFAGVAPRVQRGEGGRDGDRKSVV